MQGQVLLFLQLKELLLEPLQKLPFDGGTMTRNIDMNVHAIDNVSALTVDNINIDGKVITMTSNSSGDTATITSGTNSSLRIATNDGTGSTNADIQILAAAALTLNGADGVNIAGNSGVNTGDVDITGAAITLAASRRISLDAGPRVIDIASKLDVAGVVTAPKFTGLLETEFIVVTGKTITDTSIVGDTTINAMAGSINFRSTATSVRVTNSLVDENSVIILTKGSKGSSAGGNIRKLWVCP
jgi:hypothetical protein